MTPILVVWTDAQADAAHWKPRSELEREPRVIRTLGYDLGPIIEGHVSVAGSWDTGSDQFGGVMHIPEVCIISCSEARRWKERTL